jgi:hypothetical protein
MKSDLSPQYRRQHRVCLGHRLGRQRSLEGLLLLVEYRSDLAPLPEALLQAGFAMQSVSSIIKQKSIIRECGQSAIDECPRRAESRHVASVAGRVDFTSRGVGPLGSPRQRARLGGRGDGKSYQHCKTSYRKNFAGHGTLD